MVSSEDKTEIEVAVVVEESNGEEKGRHRGGKATSVSKIVKKEKSAEGVTYYSSSNLLLDQKNDEGKRDSEGEGEQKKEEEEEVLGRILYTPPRKVRSGFSSILFSTQHTPSNPSLNHHSHHPLPPHSPQHNTLNHSHHPQITADCKIEALCKNIVTWLNSLKKMNFVIEDVAMNLLIINSPHIWVSVRRDHSTRRSYAKKEWVYKLFGKTCNISEKNIGHAKSAKVMGDFIQWRINLSPSIPVIKSLSNSPYSSFVLALYQP